MLALSPRWTTLAIVVCALGIAPPAIAQTSDAGKQTTPSPPTASRISLADYVSRLEKIEGLLSARQLDAAKGQAAGLKDVQIVWAKGTFSADASLLALIGKAQLADGPHRTRLATTIRELRHAGGMEGVHGDRKLLEKIAAEQEPAELTAGGDIDTTLDRDLPMLERVAESIMDMLRWIGKKLKKFVDWLFDLFPDTERGKEGKGSPALRWIVFAVVAGIVLLVLILAVRVLRRSKGADPALAASLPPLGSTADEDPLSRGATEWERYAAELAAAGRFREAIRAWYHAVLVTCYAAGILHFRKGRTNWEYVASLPPTLTWRADLIELTRRFEKEWYGADLSTAETNEECSERARGILDALERESRGAA